MNTERELLKESVLEMMDRGADIIKIGKAAEHGTFTVEQLQQMHQENRLAFEYDRAKDMIVITKDIA